MKQLVSVQKARGWRWPSECKAGPDGFGPSELEGWDLHRRRDVEIVGKHRPRDEALNLAEEPIIHASGDGGERGGGGKGVGLVEDDRGGDEVAKEAVEGARGRVRGCDGLGEVMLEIAKVEGGRLECARRNNIENDVRRLVGELRNNRA